MRIEELLRGTSLEVRVNDPANPDGTEILPLTVPPETAAGARFRLTRHGHFAGGIVAVRVRLLPSARFKTSRSGTGTDTLGPKWA